jgi:hypothetical protein
LASTLPEADMRRVKTLLFGARSGIKSESDLESYLIMANFSVFNVPTSLDNLEPIHISNRLVGLRHRGVIASSMLVSDEPTSSNIL